MYFAENDADNPQKNKFYSTKNNEKQGGRMDVQTSIQKRVEWIRKILSESGAKGIIYGNSGGKDCTLVGALCKLATDNVLGVIMPCQSSQNYGSDRDDALRAGKHFGIQQIEIDLTKTKEALVAALGDELTRDNAGEANLKMANVNINPRLRMTTLYALGQARGYLVAGTGNLDEATLGYFTKWGDGAHDFNPIADLTVGEIYEHLRALKAPSTIIEKAPSAGLYQGQTDESELGIKYADVDKYLRGEQIPEEVKEKIEKAKTRALHKACMPRKYPD
ncbi:MAG TPA: NAD(+) synthase [Clostridiales bacterium]|nr:NAD(+) synthase [Clostridiales bacterium]